ncbi:MAG: erythromycin biosynthesis sensory transduction protein eryC1 [Rhodospirillaceae bacterium TMED8]|nr:erythromycin biosynthesis sensory transduction protein eryC1 [Magnetovibrio sp.]OUT51261.1 MAG: erythromycin biosynthesis sensory transduction protein eryC1 [Rhodospirillaceae bacterium TMED8]|tara:strand:- start:12095 stop:13210 length:1116 start_codon:yes stop_codon:yes gene_type:complete
MSLFCAQPKAQYLSHKSAIDTAVKRVLDSGTYILGTEVKNFEDEFAAYCDTKVGVGVSSGTEAIHLALRAANIGDGDDVITVSHTATATISAIELVGANPIIIDIDPIHFTLDPTKVANAITHRTKAIVPVHLYGQPADMDPIMDIARQHKIHVIEDCAQAHGAKYKGRRVGSIGDLGCFSFYPTKNLGAIGDGGMIVGNDVYLTDRCRRIREYGWDKERRAIVPGWNTRLDEVQAAILRAKLPTLDTDNKQRRKIADTYDRELGKMDIQTPAQRADCEHVFHLYVIRHQNRDALISHMKKADIYAGIHYHPPVHHHPAYSDRLKIAKNMGCTEAAAAEIVSLPLYPELTNGEVKTIIASLQEFFSERHHD